MMGIVGFMPRLAKTIREKTKDQVAIISFHKLTDTELQSIHKELNKTLCAGEVQLIESGIRYPGFFAVRQLSWKMDKYKYFSILLYLPLVPFFGMGVMFFLKRFRTKLS